MKNVAISVIFALSASVGGMAHAMPSLDQAAEAGIADYVRSRLINPHAAMIRAGDSLYRATAVVNGRAWTGWAVDIRLNAKIGHGRRTGFHRRTVLISENGPVAFRADVKDFEKLD